jgi:hypothetical protein
MPLSEEVPTLPRDEQIQDSCAAAYMIRPQSRAVQDTSQPTHIRGLGCSKGEGVKFKSGGACGKPVLKTAELTHWDSKSITKHYTT